MILNTNQKKTSIKSLLFVRLQAAINKVDAIAIATAQPDVADLVDIAVADTAAVGFRAGWVLEQVYRYNFSHFLPHFPYFLNQLPLTKNLSAQRSFTTIVCLATAPKKQAVLQSFLNTKNSEKLIETLFTWLVNPGTPVAVKANCMEALANLIPVDSELKAELIETIDYLCGVESVAFFGRAKKVLPRLKC